MFPNYTLHPTLSIQSYPGPPSHFFQFRHYSSGEEPAAEPRRSAITLLIVANSRVPSVCARVSLVTVHCPLPASFSSMPPRFVHHSLSGRSAGTASLPALHHCRHCITAGTASVHAWCCGDDGMHSDASSQCPAVRAPCLPYHGRYRGSTGSRVCQV